MRIGIDIDNVITSFDNELLKEYIKHDKELSRKGKINENADYIRRGMFNWSEEDISFYKANIDIMIEDKVDNIKKKSSKIPVICFHAGYNEECEGNNFYRAYSWYDIYNKIV